MRVSLIYVCFTLMLMPAFAKAEITEKIRALAPFGLIYVIDEHENILVSQNADKSFVPASVAKIATAWLAMEELGDTHRFETNFYVDEKRTLFVRGSGDPFLVSEELEILAPKLIAATGNEPFSEFVLDTSYFPDRITIPGIETTDEAYDALNSALAVNFNTIAAIRKGNTVRSAEKQTPITPLAISQFRTRGPNGRGRISLAQEKPELSAIYAGELLSAFIEKSGGKISGQIKVGTVPPDLKPIYVHRQSRSLSEILMAMLLSSNNYIANQLFLEIGANRLGGPVSLEKSLKVVEEIFAKHGLLNDVTFVEGSGVSRDNRFTSQSLAKLLHLFAPHADLLKKTNRGSGYKTGTLSDVKTLAGYAITKNHGKVRFVISLKGNTGRLRFRILEAIENEL